MKHSFVCLLLALAWGCSPTGPTPDVGPTPDSSMDAGPDDFTDTDGDGISDANEGKRDNRDTDGDGTPDYRDDDSDGDGLSDSFEAGTDSPSIPPRDADGDGKPDFIDDDSDGNGIPDGQESTGDTDGDGTPDYADNDDDNDRILDSSETSDDTDGDGIPNNKDPDSDNDNILDGDERDVDTDGDGLLDWADPDSDNDLIPDSEEAGDRDLFTRPVDTDMDLIPDFRDPDSDNDGVSDTAEREAGTNPLDGDSDADGVSDLIEAGAGTNPLDAADNPRANGDFVYLVPYMEPADPPRDTLEFQTALQLADVYFNFDVTGSMRDELVAMANATTGVPGIIAQLACAPNQDPVTTGCIPNIYTGVGVFEEIDSFANRRALQGDATVTAMSVPTSTGLGSDEQPMQAISCIANGGNCNNTATRNCVMTGIGCPGFRRDAVRILVHIADAASQGCTASRCTMYDAQRAGADLARENIKFIGLFGTGDGAVSPDGEMNIVGTTSGSVDANGQPFVFAATDAGVVQKTVDAVRSLAQSPFRVTIDPTDEEGDDGDAIPFIDHLVISTMGPNCTDATPKEDTDGNTYLDAFSALRPGTPVCWDVVPIMNDIQPPELTPLVYKAKLTVSADGSPVDSRFVYFLVPPRVEIPDAPD